MTDNEVILAALAMDLKRVALGTHRGSAEMAKRFKVEALKRTGEIDSKNLQPYMREVLKKITKDISADDALMYSTLIQNYVLHK